MVPDRLLPDRLLPDRLLPDLLAAERALGRLDQALSDPARRHRYRHDAARRSAAGVIRLDGHRLDPHDFQIALAVPEQASGEPWRAALLSALIAQLPLGLTTGDARLSPRHTAAVTLDPRLSGDRRARMDAVIQSDVVAAARASVAELNGFDLGGGGAETGGEEADTATTASPIAPLPPWTLAWLEELHRRWSLAQLGRPVGLTDGRRADAVAALKRVDEDLSAAPGLLGAATAIRALACRADPGEPERNGSEDPGLAAVMAQRPRASWWGVVVWLAAPSLVQASCRLHFAWPALTPALARDATGYRLALSGTDPVWTAWFLATVQDLVGHELERLRCLDLIQERWEERLAPHALRTTSRLPALLPWLFERPAFTVSRAAADLKARFGLSLRGAYRLTGQLAEAGIVREVAGRGGERVWATDLSFLPPGR